MKTATHPQVKHLTDCAQTTGAGASARAFVAYAGALIMRRSMRSGWEQAYQSSNSHRNGFVLATTGGIRNNRRINSHRRGFKLADVASAVVTAWFFVVSPAYANVEQLGPVYPIVEPNLLDDIQKVLKGKEASGELKRLEREAIARSKKSAVEPKPVAGVKRTSEARRFDWDPSVIYDNDARDDEGRIIVRKGTKVNPLEYVGLRKNFLFFDGRDVEQVAFAKYLISHYKGGVKPILTAGNIPNVSRALNTRMYYDQGGFLVNRFGIRQVPAIVSQEQGAKVLRVDELLVPERFTIHENE